MNTSPLQDKTWFVVLLVGGLLGFAFGLFGFATMVAYLIAGPDGTALSHEPRTPTSEPMSTPPTGTLAPSA